MISIPETMNAFLAQLENKHEGGPFSRFKSWEYCHSAFLEAHRKNRPLSAEEIDSLALMLSFYLASWGMYRGSSFLLQRDYKAQIPVVAIVLNPLYQDLWEFNPVGKSEEEIQNAAHKTALCFEQLTGAYLPIEERAVLDEAEEGEEDSSSVSVTLLTKILMGTFAVCPALDRFFQDGLKRYRAAHPSDDTLGKNGTAFSEKLLVRLFHFARAHEADFDLSPSYTNAYPLMKKIDMYFWQVGYECSFIAAIKKLAKKEDFDGTKTVLARKRLLAKVSYFLPNAETEHYEKDAFLALSDLIRDRNK